jgi:glycopeptide antibiotics resistance protein
MIRRVPRWIWWAASAAIAAWLLWMTLRPNPTVAGDLEPLTGSAVGRAVPAQVLIGLAGNVAVFVPLGVTLALALGERPTPRRLAWATLLGAGLSLFIEIAQIALPSRVASAGDLALNALGTALGAASGIGLDRR